MSEGMSTRPHSRRRSPRSLRMGMTMAAIAAAMAMVVTACGSSSPPASAPADASSGPVTLRFAYVPLAAITPVFVGMDQGIFAKHGIKIEPQAVPAAQLSTILVSKQADFSINAVEGVIQGASNGLPLRILGQISVNEPGAVGGSGSTLIVKKGSPIKSAKDLVGKKLGVSNLKSSGETAVQKLVMDATGDPSARVTAIAIPNPAAAAALEAGRVDAAIMSDPWATEAIQTGKFIAPIGSPIEQAFRGGPNMVLTCTAGWASENPKLVANFKAAMHEAIEYAQGHPDAVRKVMIDQYKASEKVVGLTHFPKFSDELNVDMVQKDYEILQQLKFITGEVDVKSLIVK